MSKNTDSLRIEYMALNELVRAKRNPKRHDVASIRASIERFGVAAVCAVVNEKTGVMVAGHGRCEVLAAMHAENVKPPSRVQVRADGVWMVPVLRGVSFKNASEAEAFLVADNRLVELGGWDRQELAELLKDIDRYDGIGYASNEIDNLLASLHRDQVLKKTPEEKLDGFIDSSVRQMVLFYGAEEFDRICDALDAIGEQHGIDNHTDTVSWLVTRYMENQASAVAVAAGATG